MINVLWFFNAFSGNLISMIWHICPKIAVGRILFFCLIVKYCDLSASDKSLYWTRKKKFSILYNLTWSRIFESIFVWFESFQCFWFWSKCSWWPAYLLLFLLWCCSKMLKDVKMLKLNVFESAKLRALVPYCPSIFYLPSCPEIKIACPRVLKNFTCPRAPEYK